MSITRQTLTHCRLFIGGATAILCTVTSLVGVRPTYAQESFAKHVPADAGFFVEVRKGEDLLTLLMQPQLWTTLAEIAGQPAQIEEAEQWRKRIVRTVKMEPAEAIRVLLSEQVAFVGDGLGRSQDGVIYCRPRGRGVKQLIETWQARPIGDPRLGKDVFELPGRIGVATIDDALLIGDANPLDGTFRRFAAPRAADRKSLSDDATYQSLLKRVPSNPDGVLFARFASATTSRPAGASRQASRPVALTPIDAADAFLLALHRDGNKLHITAVAATPPSVELPRGPRASERLMDSVPDDALGVFEGTTDFAKLLDLLDRLPARNPLRLAARLPSQSDLVSGFASTLEGPFCFAVGRGETPTSQPTSRPAAPLPAVAILLRVRDADKAEYEFDRLVDACVAAGNILQLGRGKPEIPAIEIEKGERGSIYSLDLSQLISGRDLGERVPLRLAWTVDRGVLIFATDASWLRRILTQRGDGPSKLAQRFAGVRPAINADSQSLLVADGRRVQALTSDWLEYLKVAAPDMLKSDWWKLAPPPGGRVRVGVDVDQNSQDRVLTVRSVIAGEAADGRLRVGDVITGCNGKPFATTQPISEYRTGLKQRPHFNRFDLLIERGGSRMAVSLPLPLLDPIQTLRRIAAIGEIVGSVAYHEDWSDPAGPRGHVTIELRASK
ncbi:MAG: PDZ domain-containing protein [Phycisphaerae bacterium]